MPGCCVPVPQVHSRNLTSITVTWDRENCHIRNGRPQNYTLSYKRVESAQYILNVSINIDKRNYTANLLFPRSTYSIEVALVNHVGMGPITPANISTSSPTGELT